MKIRLIILSGMNLEAAEQLLEMKQPGAVLHRVASTCANEGDGGRTRNLRIDSPVL